MLAGYEKSITKNQYLHSMYTLLKNLRPVLQNITFCLLFKIFYKIVVLKFSCLEKLLYIYTIKIKHI